MGSYISFPLAKKPEISELPKTMHVDVSAFDEFRAVNAKICENMHRQNMRSKQELTMFNAYRRDWSAMVKNLKKKYPKWSSEDILNLRYQYEVMVKSYGYLLHFCNFKELLDSIHDDSSPEQQRAMFESADTYQYSAINFEEYLQLMDKIDVETPVHRPPGIEEDRDEIMVLIYDLSQTHIFKQMAYGLF